MDYEVHACTRQCAATGREFAPGETYYSALVSEGSGWRRFDYSLEAWNGPPEGAIGWWKSRRPGATKVRGAPNEILLSLFDQLEDRADNQDMRYVLSLFLVRRRVMRLEETERQPGGEVLVLHCPRRESTYRVAVVAPEESRVRQIQEELSQLLQS